ncbi:MAG: hypothetical protein KKF30_19010 [Proteobacteria bacterium]|nr:hypothetical protein [Pseudomonadota bacterium]
MIRSILFALIIGSCLIAFASCSKEADVIENEIAPFMFNFPTGNFLSEDPNEIGGATIYEDKGVIAERPGDGFREKNVLGPELDVELRGVSLFTGEGSYLRFAGNFSRDYLSFSVAAPDQHPLCFRKYNGAWRYLSGKGTVSINGKQYRLGAARDTAWFMQCFASNDDIMREKSILELTRWPAVLSDPRIIEKLYSFLSDSSIFVRRSAAFQVGNLNLKEGVKPLEKALRDETDGNASFAMREALAKLRNTGK